jgi:hypothetical protein
MLNRSNRLQFEIALKLDLSVPKALRLSYHRAIFLGLHCTFFLRTNYNTFIGARNGLMEDVQVGVAFLELFIGPQQVDFLKSEILG